MRILFSVIVMLIAAPAFAAQTFTLQVKCPAYQSFKKKTNPGKIKVKAGRTLDVIATNVPNGPWVQVRIPSANPKERWVSRDCGILSGEASQPTNPNHSGPSGNVCRAKDQHDSHVLAVSWQPGFCEHKGKDDKPECKDMARGELVVDHVTLHGLWPNKKECKKNYGSCGGPEENGHVKLTDETLSLLKPWMPNARYDQWLVNHEWDKHGTCRMLDADGYFRESVALTQKIAASAIGRILSENIGSSVAVKDYFSQIDAELGAGASQRVALSCSKGFITELQISLPRDIDVNQDLGKMIQAASPMSGANSCGSEFDVEESGE